MSHPLGWQLFKKKNRQKITVSEDVEKLEPLCTASGNGKCCSGSSENSITGPQKSKHRMTLRSSNSSSRFTPWRIESRDSKRHLYTHVHNSIIYNNKRWKWLKGTSADGWINKMWSIHTIKYFAVLRQEIPTLYNINLEDIMLNERSRKRDKKTNTTWFHSDEVT